jgi:autoinducer 2-degrading protein
MEKELIVKWKIREINTPGVLEMLAELVEKTRGEAGNLLYNIYQSAENPNEFILHERYIDSAAVEAHKLSSHYQEIVLNRIIPHLVLRELSSVKKLY